MALKILVIRFGSLGDVILTSPAVLNLKLAYPDSHLVYLTKPRFAPVVRMMSGVDEVAELPEERASAAHYAFLMDLDRRNFDLVVDLHGNVRSWAARKLLSSTRTVAYPKRRLDRWLLAHQRYKSLPDNWPHTIDLYNSALEVIGIPLYCQRPVLHRQGLEGASTIDMPAGDYVVIAPGAAHSTKQWPLERFQGVARLLHQQFGVAVVWAVMGADAGRTTLSDSLPPGSFTELVDYPVEKLASVIAGARLTIANDSGLTHLSSAVGTPVLAIFGPTHPALGFAPRGLFDQVVEVDEYCRPCSLHGKAPCYRTEQFCFTRISSEMVIEAAADLLTRPLTKALFVDRDGTVIIDKHYQSDPNQIALIPGAAESLRLAHCQGYKVIMLSNQSGVARGYFSPESVDRMHARVLELLAQHDAQPDAVVYCPHHPSGTVPEYTIRCQCRKPYPGMAETMARQFRLNLHQSVMIGDKIDDVNLGLVIGAKSGLVLTGHGLSAEQSLRDRLLYNGIGVFKSLIEAVQHLAV